MFASYGKKVPIELNHIEMFHCLLDFTLRVTVEFWCVH
jgi:hypothetical protein